MPVSSRPTPITSTPMPGTCRSFSMLACAEAGSSACGADNSQANMPSIAPSSHVSTQTVMATGVQTSKPASRYFFTPLPTAAHAVCLRRAVSLRPPWAPLVRRGRGRGGGFGGLGLAAIGGCCRCAAAEVRGVPAGPLQLETGGRELLDETRLRTHGAGLQHRLGDFLQDVLPVSAGLALVGVDRHVGPGWRKTHDYRFSRVQRRP